MADDSGDVIDRARPRLPKQFSIEEILKAGSTLPEVVPPAAGPEIPPEATPGDETESLPLPGSPYKAYWRVSGHSLTLHLLLADQSRESFSYGDLRRMRWLPAADPGSGPELVLRFVEAEITEVRLSGRNLEPLYDAIGRHAITWLRQLPPRWDFQVKGEPVITGIDISTLER